MSPETTRPQLLEELMAFASAPAVRHMRRWPGGPLSLIHLHVLAVLAEDGPQSMRELAKALDVSGASATGIVDRMERRGVVTRQDDPHDRRVVRVAITDAGRDVLAGFTEVRRQHLGEMLSELTDEEAAGLLVGVRAMRRARDRWLAERSREGDA